MKFLKYNYSEDLCIDEHSEYQFGTKFQKMYDERERGTLNQINRFINYDFVKLSSKDHLDGF